MDLEAACKDPGFLGRPGEFLSENQVCVCPPGYNGVDDWETRQRCNVNEKAFNGLHVFFVLCSSISLVFCTWTTLTLIRRWKFNSSEAGGKSLFFRRGLEGVARLEWQRKRASIWCCICLCCHFIGSIGYHILELAGQNKEESIFTSFAYTFVVISTVWTSHFHHFAWLYTLPHFHKFQAVLPEVNFFSTMPGKGVRILETLIETVFFTLVIFILPQLIQEETLFNAISVVGLMVHTLVSSCIIHFLNNRIMELYIFAERAFSKTTGYSSELRLAQEALVTVSQSKRGAYVSIPLFLSIYGAFLGTGMEEIYLLKSLIDFFGLLLVSFPSQFLNSEGGMLPIKKPDPMIIGV